ncbi:hypothetical protein D9M68_749020 [compost metagenome]
MDAALHLTIPGGDVFNGRTDQARQDQTINDCLGGIDGEVTEAFAPTHVTQLVFKSDKCKLQALPGGRHDAHAGATKLEGNLDNGGFCFDDFHAGFLGSGRLLMAKKPPTKPAPSCCVR